ncbi:hypothetical protein MBAV_002931 [Candidatus Magnetobacterium bavaricum]|uniref:Uncharacterized protein n=1 Tax=Candidatus Magnetobacterium bavaricum TaxID=29290 RepID=A0A0F3GSN1_9BACT|nr:hypothetical protein MBAV_002931 [Candidatus Magnetobacterium bavaricum]
MPSSGYYKHSVKNNASKLFLWAHKFSCCKKYPTVKKTAIIDLRVELNYMIHK